jgi:hypothetical protein
MKKQRTNGNNIIETDDDRTVLEITNSLKKIDQLPLFTPDLEWFEEMAFESKAIIKKKFRKDLTIFLLIAAIIITSVIVTLFQMPIIFFVIQIMVIVFVAIYSGILVLKKVEDV